MATFQEVDREMPAVKYSRQDYSINIYINICSRSGTHNSRVNITRPFLGQSFCYCKKTNKTRLFNRTHNSVLTSISRVYDKISHLERVSFHQARTKDFHPAGVSDLRLHHHDGDGAVGNVASVLLNADQVLSDLSGNERYTCG